jgi:hypothetical protein
MKKLSTPRTLTLVNKGIQSYTFESNTFHRFTISKYDGQWEMNVEYIFHEEPAYGGMFYFDTLKDAKVFAANYYRAKMA